MQLERITPATTNLVELLPTAEDYEIAMSQEVPASIQNILFDPLPSVHALIAMNQTGKTRFALWLAMAAACGQTPWPGGDVFPEMHVLFLSREQSMRRILETAYALYGRPSNGGGRFPRWEQNLRIIAKDSPAWTMLRTLDDEKGLPLLRELLRQCRDAGRPIDLLILDSLSRLKPADVVEKDPDSLGPFVDKLDLVCVDFNAHMVITHHQGHEQRSDPRNAGRGGSSLGAVTQAQWLLELGRDDLHRKLTVSGNSIPEARHVFRVAEPESPGLIQFFELEESTQGRDEDRPPRSVKYKLEDYVEPGEEFTKTGLAREFSGGKGSSGRWQKHSEECIRDARTRGLLVTEERREGAATYLRRKVL